jgi:hypothetical protein
MATFAGNLTKLDALAPYLPREAIEILKSALTPGGEIRYDGTLHLTKTLDAAQEREQWPALLLDAGAQMQLDGKARGVVKWCRATSEVWRAENDVLRSTDKYERRTEYYVRAHELKSHNCEETDQPFDLQIVSTGDVIPEVRIGDVFWYVRDNDDRPISPGNSRRWIPFTCADSLVPAFGVIASTNVEPISKNGRYVFPSVMPKVIGGGHFTFVNSDADVEPNCVGLCTVAGEAPTTVLMHPSEWIANGWAPGMYTGPGKDVFSMVPGSCGYMIVGTGKAFNTAIVVRNAADLSRKVKIASAFPLLGTTTGQVYHINALGAEELTDTIIPITDLGMLDYAITTGTVYGLVRWWPDREKWIFEHRLGVSYQDTYITGCPYQDGKKLCVQREKWTLPAHWPHESAGICCADTCCSDSTPSMPAAPTVDPLLLAANIAPENNPRHPDDVVRVIMICEACEHYDAVRFCHIIDCEKRTKSAWQSADGHCPDHPPRW